MLRGPFHVERVSGQSIKGLGVYGLAGFSVYGIFLVVGTNVFFLQYYSRQENIMLSHAQEEKHAP